MAIASRCHAKALRRTAGALLASAAVFFAPVAQAHDVPPSTVMLDIGNRRIDVELQLPIGDLGSALSLPLAASPRDVVAKYGPAIERYVAKRFLLRAANGQPFAREAGSLEMKTTRNPNWTSNDWVVVHERFASPAGASTEAFTIDDTVVVERVMSHESMLYVRRDLRHGLVGDQPMAIGMAGFGNTHVAVDGSGGSWWQGLRQLFGMGMRHIAEGPDHLLFLLALLLPAALVVHNGRWVSGKPMGDTVRAIVRVVTGFTIGHSVSLALAAAGWIVAPTRLIETLIAMSILVSCLHAWRPMFAGREAWIAGGFGLVHGLAFAETLTGLSFDGMTLLTSLVGFNLGIEAMQLVVVAILLPIFVWLTSTRIEAPFRRVGVIFAAACATGWIAERAFGLHNPLQCASDWLAPPPLWFDGSLLVASLLATGALTKNGIVVYGRNESIRRPKEFQVAVTTAVFKRP